MYYPGIFYCRGTQAMFENAAIYWLRRTLSSPFFENLVAPLTFCKTCSKQNIRNYTDFQTFGTKTKQLPSNNFTPLFFHLVLDIRLIRRQELLVPAAISLALFLISLKRFFCRKVPVLPNLFSHKRVAVLQAHHLINTRVVDRHEVLLQVDQIFSDENIVHLPVWTASAKSIFHLRHQAAAGEIDFFERKTVRADFDVTISRCLSPAQWQSQSAGNIVTTKFLIVLKWMVKSAEEEWMVLREKQLLELQLFFLEGMNADSSGIFSTGCLGRRSSEDIAIYWEEIDHAPQVVECCIMKDSIIKAIADHKDMASIPSVVGSTSASPLKKGLGGEGV